jgi:acyl carrier protein
MLSDPSHSTVMPSSDVRTLAAILESAIGARAMPAVLDDSTVLLGEIPELDSMALLAILTQIEERFGVRIDDDAVGAEIFETFGTLLTFVRTQIAAA